MEGEFKPVTFAYDADGNLLSDNRGMYQYDGFGHMTEAVMEDSSTLSCRYDAEGLRHEMEENGTLFRFLYSGRDVVCEKEEDGGTTRYIRGNGRLAASDCENARTYYHYAADRLGSVLAVLAGNEYGTGETGNETGNRILCSYTYDAFGTAIDFREQVKNRYRFTGEQYDAVTGQYYLRARYYNPVIGRFTRMDSYHGDGLNLYAYVGNNPVRYVDPSGCCRSLGMEEIGSGERGSGSSFNEFTPPSIYKNEDGIFTNGKYTIDTKGMNRHRLNPSNKGKSQFLYDVDSDKAVLDAAAYADEFDLWGGSDHGNKAKVPVVNGPVGVVAETGELTDYINVYRTANGKVHGSPANHPK